MRKKRNPEGVPPFFHYLRKGIPAVIFSKQLWRCLEYRSVDLRTCHDPSAISQPLAVMLLVAITLLLAALLLLLIDIPAFNPAAMATPSFLQILRVSHLDEEGDLNYDSRVILVHNGTAVLDNRNLSAEFFRDDFRVPAEIGTLNGDLFISTHHYGVQTMGGLGCSGPTWLPGEKISLDFSDGTFHPGDRVRVDIYLDPGGSLVSRHSFTA